MARLETSVGERPLLQHRISQTGVQRPGDAGDLAPAKRQPNRRRRHADPQIAAEMMALADALRSQTAEMKKRLKEEKAAPDKR
jgi:hypothetical protein